MTAVLLLFSDLLTLKTWHLIQLEKNKKQISTCWGLKCNLKVNSSSALHHLSKRCKIFHGFWLFSTQHSADSWIQRVTEEKKRVRKEHLSSYVCRFMYSWWWEIPSLWQWDSVRSYTQNSILSSGDIQISFMHLWKCLYVYFLSITIILMFKTFEFMLFVAQNLETYIKRYNEYNNMDVQFKSGLCGS